MKVHLVNRANAREHRHLLEENYRTRHRVFVETLGWKDLRRDDGRDVDEFDNDDATHMILERDGRVTGGARFTSLTRPNLTMNKFADLVEEPLPGPLANGADWTRFYVEGGRRMRFGPSDSSSALFCAAMEFGLGQGLTYFTFVSTISMVGLVTSFGWRITPLGAPREVEGTMTLAACVDVDLEALANIRAVTGFEQSTLAPVPQPSLLRPAPAGNSKWRAGVTN